jgi:hypothetical protein
LHEERMSVEKPFLRIDDIPDGVFVEFHEKPYLIFDEKLFEWSFAGYAASIEKPKNVVLKIITPLSTVRSIKNGFQPIIFNER